MVAQQEVAIVLVTSMVVGVVVVVVSTPTLEAGEWTTTTQTLLEQVDLIASLMVDDKNKDQPLYVVHVPYNNLTIYRTCTTALL